MSLFLQRTGRMTDRHKGAREIFRPIPDYQYIALGYIHIASHEGDTR